MPRLSPEELERYSRQLPIIGEEGQLKLKSTSVLVAGAGGLGSAILYYLAAAGIGKLIIIDDGVVELSNLQRQVLYNVNDIGRPKAIAAAEKVKSLNPGVEVVPVTETITEELLDRYVSQADIVVDALDNWATRFLLDKSCWKHYKPLVHAGVGEFYGQVTVVKRGVTPCLRCIFKNARDRGRGSVIVMAHTPGLVGLLEVNEVFKLALGYGEPLFNKILLVNLKTSSIDVIELKGFECGDLCE
jgi:molybdopterin/thiamine biosynthesis adenylyltransferase